MKRYILILILIVHTILSSNAQTYFDNPEAKSLASIANSTILSNSARIPLSEAFDYFKMINDDFFSAPEDLPCEYWIIDGMMVSVVTYPIRTEEDYPRDDLKKLQRALEPSIHISDPDNLWKKSIAVGEWYSEIKYINNFEVLIYYFRKKSDYKSFQIQDNKGKYKTIGTIHIKKEEDAPKAHSLINKILNDLTFKE